MNQVNPKKLLNSKWTKVNVANKEKHFMVTEVNFDEHQKVVDCTIEAVKTHNSYAIDWRTLKDHSHWHIGWQ
jgi:tryptophan-rich hypothetical protein